MTKIPRHKIEMCSSPSAQPLKAIPVVKKTNYEIIEGKTITGDAPKLFIRLYDNCLNDTLAGTNKIRVIKTNKKSWPLYIAKTGHKWYPMESVTEYLLNQLGIDFGLQMAVSAIRMIGGQVRFLSKYFLNDKDEELIHGADIFAGFINDKSFIEEIEEEELARDLFTLQFVEKAIFSTFPYQATDIISQFVKMLLFDALVGNNDRHFYNWGVVRSITQKFQPYFSPVYDTARGLFWNTSENKIVEKSKSLKDQEAYITKYCKNSRPKIGFEDIGNIDHFKLVNKIIETHFYIDKEELVELFSLATIERMYDTIDHKFVNIMSAERRGLIKKCLNYRFNKINDMIK